MREIEAVNVPVAKPAKIANANSVENGTAAGILIDNVSDGRGANEKTVVVIMQAGVILVPGSHEFRGVTGKKEILQVHIAEKHLLVAPFERIEAAVGVFLKEVKICKIVFDAIAVKIPEKTQCRLFIHEKKAAEIGVELLDAGARGQKIIVGADVAELHFGECFLKTEMIVETVGSVARIGTDYSKFANFQIVKAEFRRDANAPIHGLEGSVTM